MQISIHHGVLTGPSAHLRRAGSSEVDTVLAHRTRTGREGGRLREAEDRGDIQLAHVHQRGIGIPGLASRPIRLKMSLEGDHGPGGDTVLAHDRIVGLAEGPTLGIDGQSDIGLAGSLQRDIEIRDLTSRLFDLETSSGTRHRTAGINRFDLDLGLL